MNSNFSLVRLLVFHSFISQILSEYEINLPLIFNPKTHQLYSSWDSVTKDDGIPYAIACPASNNNEHIYNNEVVFENKYSFDWKSVIVRHVVENTLVDFTQKQCTKKLELSVAVHSPSNKKKVEISHQDSPLDEEKFIEIGYEVFFKEKDFKKDFEKSIYNDFQRVSELAPSRYSTLKDDEREAGPVMKKEIVHDLSKNDIEEVDVSMVYVWLSKFVIRFDFSTLSLKSFTYFLDNTIADTVEMDVECEDSFLGIQMYGFEFPSTYYEPDQQVKIFSPAVIPKTKENTRITSAGNCVKQYNLLPAYQFQSNFSSKVSCSQLTTIPLWNNGLIEEVLDYAEYFLVALAQATSNKLKITAGVRDVLSLPSQYDYQKNPISFYMDFVGQENHFPVPKIIYKIVSYQLRECRGEEDTCWFDTVIVFHNQPVVSEDDKICNEDKCASWGFDSIQYLSTIDKVPEGKSPFVYCCELDAEMRTLLDHPKGEDLDLKNFPRHYDKDSKEIKRENIQEAVETRLSILKP